MSITRNGRVGGRWGHRGLALFVGAVVALVLGVAVSVQAETVPPTTTTSTVAAGSAIGTTGAIRTHSNDGAVGASAPFSVACGSCHAAHEAPAPKLLALDGPVVCAKCHDLDTIHGDPATKQAVAALPAPSDCLTCHPHSSGFMPAAVATALTLSKQELGYDDLDSSDTLSPGDRVHYRVDYGNTGPVDVMGAVLRDQPDMAHVASVEAIAGGGVFDGTAIQWNMGTLAAGVSAYVTYDVVLEGSAAFDGGATTPTTAAPSTTESSTTSTAPAPDSTTITATDSTTTTDSSSTTTSTAVDNSTTMTTLTTTPAAVSPIDVVNTAVLTADGRGPVSASVIVSVAVAGSLSSVNPTDLTGGSTTATTAGTTSPTIAPVYVDVSNSTALTSDNRAPVSALATISELVAGSPSPTPATTSTTKLPNTAWDPFALTLSNQALGYDDTDGNGNLSPGDRVHYRIDYGNPGQVDATGVVLRDGLDTAYVASVEAIIADGTLEREPAAGIPTAIQWNIGTLAAGATGFVTYDLVLRPALVMVRDGWFFPVQGPHQYYDDFGDPRYAGGYHTHKGNDLLCALGTPLVAVVDGIISRADPIDSGLGGRHIWLRGDDGNSYYYAHLSAIQAGIVSDVRVEAGQVLGFAGDSGDAKGGPVHLHFEIHPAGGPAVDPYLVLKGVLSVSEVPIPVPETTTTTTTLPATDSTTTTTTPPTDTTTPPTDTTTPPTDTTTPPTDTTATTIPVTDTTTITGPPVTDSTTTTTPPATDSTTTTGPPATDSTTTTTPPVTDTTTTTAPPTTTTTAPVAAAMVFAVPGGALLGVVRRRRFF